VAPVAVALRTHSAQPRDRLLSLGGQLGPAKHLPQRRDGLEDRCRVAKRNVRLLDILREKQHEPALARDEMITMVTQSGDISRQDGR
jgi:hypothetical protein